MYGSTSMTDFVSSSNADRRTVVAGIPETLKTLTMLLLGLSRICPPDSGTHSAMIQPAHCASDNHAFHGFGIPSRIYASPHMFDDASENAFTQLVPSLHSSVTAELESRNVHAPTPIQAAAMTRIYEGESLVLHAETGSGKSLAFLLPALARMGLAGATRVPPVEEQIGKVLVVAPTRELAVQLANDAALIIPAPGAVQIVAVGATPNPLALLEAPVITCTAPELLALQAASGDSRGVVDSVLAQVRVLVLDELDVLLPVSSIYGQRAAQRKKAVNRIASEPAEDLVRQVFEQSSSGDLQVLAASATASRPTRLKLDRVLRRDPLGRWYNEPLKVVRPESDSQQDLSKVPRAVVIPPGVKHFFKSLPGSVKLQQLAPALPKTRTSTKRITLKQKRAAKALARKIAQRRPTEGAVHPLFIALQEVIHKTTPSSALVFLCRSSGLTVRRAVRDLQQLGLHALALHEAIGLEHATPNAVQARLNDVDPLHPVELPQDGSKTKNSISLRMVGKEMVPESLNMDPSVELQKRHRAISETISDRQGKKAGLSEGAPLIITFEDMARGLHFDAVDTVYILGMPDSPATYLHLAGRTGRQPVLEGNVVTICQGSSHEQLLGWSSQLGGIQFEKLGNHSMEEGVVGSVT